VIETLRFKRHVESLIVMLDPHQRATIMKKTASFAVVHMTVAFGVGYVLSGSVLVGGAIALVEPLVNTVAYFFHEKFWERVGLRDRHVNGNGDAQWRHC
jgi:uncharacterized membrane protein